MRWDGLVVVVSLGLLACTQPNPAKSCSDGTCTDPAFPFCDLTGAVGGEAGACIAASCTADTFIECRDDVEVRCNVDGSNYNLTQCERGCDSTLGGCRLCNPGETACTNGAVASCDETGVPTIVEECPLGCFGSEPRCTEIDPSNNLAMYFDMVPDPPSLTLENGTFNVSTGEVLDNGQPIDVPSFAVSAPSGGVALRVFVVDSLSITQASTLPTTPGPALAILARGDIAVTGKLTVGKAGSPVGLAACNAGAGAGPSAPTTPCNGSSSSSGGGAFATNGAKGGDLGSYPGGSGGIANGNDKLVPLRGGCPSGPRYPSGATKNAGRGGGAVQIVSRTRIVIDGIIDGRGESGGRSGWSMGEVRGASSLESGGAGGAILLEAPSVELGPNGSLDAIGGAGGQCTNPPGSFLTYCSMGGIGAAPGVAATPGENHNATCLNTNEEDVFTPGGGGGGLGRIRINTADGTYVKSSTASEGGVTTAGELELR